MNGKHYSDPIEFPSEFVESHKISFELSRDGNPVISYRKDDVKQFVHSKYTPKKEAKRFLEGNLAKINETLGKSGNSQLILYGLGCGYQIKELVREYPGLTLYVFDFNPELVHYSFGFIDFREILENPRINLVITKKEPSILENLDKVQNCQMIVYKPTLPLIPDELNHLKEILIDIDIQRQTVSATSNLLLNNFRKNVSVPYYDWSSFHQLFDGIPMVLVSAGPSLGKNISLLTKVKNHALIGAVGTALTPLLKAGIEPDFFMVTDPKHYTLEQIRDCNKSVLFYLSTVFSGVVETYIGPKFMVYQKGFIEAENLAADRGVPAILTGGSVATTLLDLMIKMGANLICFVGQDLAYTNGRTHATGTHLYRTIDPMDTTTFVDNFYQTGKVATSNNLKSYLRWIVRYIEDNRAIQFYNATEGGAFIKGCHHLKLEEFIKLIDGKNIDAERELFKEKVEAIS
ncbi:motility associated factor glycosyltransferase family protein [Effusibacillus lacus]|uniref:motility associated factor glycosyltransferase family protein n=1 Tax=Effusibacillus lacus TaxID=1348429 RepID=UPI00104C0326|nr:6-hydroxymethylpterin diphosphokinase MptE-like protein [Effusibacillus lacus]